MTTELSIAQIEAITAQPFDPARAEVLRADPDAARRVLSSRVPEAVSAWIIAEAVQARTNPSRLVAELLAEAIAARRAGAGRPVRLVDVAEVHRIIDSLAADGAYPAAPAA